MRQFFVTSISKIKSATYYSIQGLKTTFQNEFAFRLELLIALIAAPVALFLGKTPVERALLICCLFLIFIAELLNSAIEMTLDRIDLSWHELTRKGKDLASAAVFVTIINALVVWSVIIIPHFWS